MKQTNPVSWFDIQVSDLERAKTFYQKVFDIELIDLPQEWGKQALFPFEQDKANISGALVEKENRGTTNNSTIVYFASEDCITEQSRVEKAGGKILTPKTAIGEFGFIAILMDTEGNSIGLHSRE